MGMDLITVGWTTDTELPNRSAELKKQLRAFGPVLLDPESDDFILGDILDDHVPYITQQEDWEPVLDAAVDEYFAAVQGHRLAEGWPIRQSTGTAPTTFHIAGGSSWGDDPFDGWTELCVILQMFEKFVFEYGKFGDVLRTAGFHGGGCRA